VRSHEWIDRRSLALHEAVAAKLEQEPALLGVARANVKRWLAVHPAAALVAPDEDAARLRQSSPFAGVLTPGERLAILRQYDSRRA
jgi:hypothetical protein